MKSKLETLAITIIMLITIGIIIFLAMILYDEFTQTNIVNEVEEFVSNITINNDIKEKDIQEETLEVIADSSQKYNNNEVTTKEEEKFYNQLDETAKLIYKAMDENREEMKTGKYQINLGSSVSNILYKNDGEDLLKYHFQSAIEAYTYDNPDVFYIDFGKLYLNIETTTRGKSVTYKVFIDEGDNENYLIQEFSSKQEIDEALSEINNINQYFIQNKKEDTYSNIKIVHDYLVDSIEYEKTSSEKNVYNLYGALVNKRCVCEGYAKAFKYLMDELDIPCTIVIGEATNSDGVTEKHAWNYVQIDEQWYAIDCTWDDPIIIGIGFLSNSSKYKYFLKGEIEFNKDHIKNGQFTENGMIFEFPTLSKYNYSN